MRLHDDVFATLQAERAKYGAVPTDDDLGRLLNATAWAHREEGLGLSRKVGGTTVPFPGGGTICHDVLMLPDGTAWDVLVSAGGSSTPTQGDSFMITDPARGWLAPVDPGHSAPGPTPHLPPPDLSVPLAELTARVDGLAGAIDALIVMAHPPDDCDPLQWEASRWGLTLPLRRKT